MAECVFCKPTDKMRRRVVREGELAYSMVSNPSFREGQTLVIPKRHIVELAELTDQETLEIKRELGRLARLLDSGLGYEILQKYQPEKPDSDIKQSHLHIHVVPRLAGDGILVVPEPNTAGGFMWLDDMVAQAMAERLR